MDNSIAALASFDESGSVLDIAVGDLHLRRQFTGDTVCTRRDSYRVT
jgi:hypothetical protein